VTAAAARPFDPDNARIAHPARRLVGFLIDFIILFVMSLPFAVLFLGTDWLSNVEVPLELSITLEVISGVYYVVPTARRGQTLGKMVARTKVVDIDRGEIPTWTASFIRWAIPAAVGSIPVVGLAVVVVYAWLLWDRRNQGLHDKAARTIVLDVRPRV
jgi:uncharacterized RDD family membrane protein YckC